MALVGGVLGLPLMWCGVTVERNGALEAVSRAFSYVSARPIHFFFTYLLIFVLMSAVTLLSGYFESSTKISLRAGIVRTARKLMDGIVSGDNEYWMNGAHALAEPLRAASSLCHVA